WCLVVMLYGMPLASLIYLSAIHHHTIEHYHPLLEAAIEVRAHTAEFHIWFEEALEGDVSPDKAWPHFDHAEGFAGILSEAGEPEALHNGSLFHLSLYNAELGRQTEHVISDLQQLRRIAQMRIKDKQHSGIGTPIDSRFDKTYNDIIDGTMQMETLVHKLIHADMNHYENLSNGIYIFVALLAFLMIAVLQFIFRLRSSHTALDTLNSQLDENNQALQLQINARRQSEAKLQDSETRLRTMLSTAPDAIITINKAGNIVEWNHGACRIFGYAEDECTDNAITMIMPERYQQAHTLGFTRHLEGVEGNLILGKVNQFHGRHKDGHEIPLEVCISEWQKDNQYFFTAIIRDISERKKAESELHKIRACVEQTGESIVITDKAGIIEYVNPAFTRITGYSASEAIGQSPRILKSGNYDNTFYKQMWTTIASGNVWEGRITDRRKDGSFYPAMLTISPVRDTHDNITHYVGIQENLSELQKMEDQFIQAQKMEAIGTLVGGIAHNFNNALAGMTGNLYLAKSKAKAIPDVVRHISNVEQLAMQSADMVSQLMVFARNDLLVKKITPLTGYIKEVMKQMHLFVPEKIDFTFEVCEEEMQVQCDASQLHQIIMNLINNAIHATKECEQASISAHLDMLTNDAMLQARHDNLSPTASGFARLCIKDNGYGISEEHLEHIFEPFFTTKPTGEGTGLGLSMTYGSVKSHGGAIDVESATGMGTEMCILLPLIDSTVVATTADDAGEVILGHGERILIVDDEQSVRDTTADVLQSLGYKTMTAVDGRDAVNVFTDHAHEIDLVLLDVVMPNIGGVQVAQKLAQIKSGLKVLFISGYDMTNSLQLVVSKEGSQHILMKPFSIVDLSTTVRQLLDGVEL
ncbi:MAG: PAS domain S-box protein, partial [Mariprofundus sp.]|nr:PAS domain S-box protein [Mariprofundus sp.]